MTTEELDDFYSEIERAAMHIEEPFEPAPKYKKTKKAHRLNSRFYYTYLDEQGENGINVKPKTLRMTNPEDYY